MSKLEIMNRLRTEQDILDRIDNVKRLIGMETTLLTSAGAGHWRSYTLTDRDGRRIRPSNYDLLHDVRDEIQLELLSIVALCYGDAPDIGEPAPMLEWKEGDGYSTEDLFRDTWDKCLQWNA